MTTSLPIPGYRFCYSEGLLIVALLLLEKEHSKRRGPRTLTRSLHLTKSVDVKDSAWVYLRPHLVSCACMRQCEHVLTAMFVSCNCLSKPCVASAMKMETLVGSAANGLKVAGGFCMGSRIVLAPHTASPITHFPLRFAILSGSARTELLTFSTGRNETGVQFVPRITFAKGAHKVRAANQVSCVPPQPQSQHSRGMACVGNK